MFLLNTYMAISILCLVLWILASIDITHEFKKKYPDLKIPKRSFAGRVLSYVRTIVSSITPLFNIIMIYTIVFKYSEVEKRAIQRIYLECMEGNND